MAEERLQKVLARAGIASRRAAEELITKGRVKVDGRVIDQLGVRIDARKAKVEVDGKRLMAEQLVYVVLHKPRGVMCTLSDPEGRPTVAELLKPVGVRVVPVGRLDFHTSGALLCTNDGEFANALAHPRNKAKKVYVAKVQGLVHDEQLDGWRKSIEIDGRATAPAEVRRLRFEGDKTWLELTLREGRNRQVRRLGEATGSLVMRLARISHAGVTAEDLRPGQWRHLSLDELVALKRDFGVPHRVRAPGTEAWEIQVKANAKVPRVAASKRASEESHGRPAREAGALKDRESRADQGDRFARRNDARPERSPPNARADRGRAERSAPNARADRARPERRAPNQRTDRARPERSAPNERADRARPERGAPNQYAERGRAERSAPNARADRARPERSAPNQHADRGRAERSAPNARADRGRPERGAPNQHADRGRAERSAPNARADRARPERVPTRDASPAAATSSRGARISSRGGRESSRRRGT